MTRWTDRLKADPTPWLMEKACPSIRYRLLTEIEGRPADDYDVADARQAVYAYKPPQTIATARNDDGTWFNSLLGFEAMNLSRKKGPGMVWQFLALLEYGWGKDHPIIWSTSELLQGLMWEDPSIDLCEQNAHLGGDPAVEIWLRKRLSRFAMTLLLRAGFADDPGIKRKIPEVLAELQAFWDGGDVHSKIYTGTKTRMVETDDGEVEEICTMVAADAPLPSNDLLLLFAWSEELRESEGGREVLDRIVDYAFNQPRPDVEIVTVGGKEFEKRPDLEIRNLSQADFADKKLVGRLLHDLELLARAGVLERSEKAVALLEWILTLQDEEGIIRADDHVEKVVHYLDYWFFPLEDNWRGKHKKFTDVTFRTMLILHLLDR